MPTEDRNGELRERICALAHRHRRYGVGMIYLKLRQEGRIVNYKRVERLYREQQLQVRRRKRKKVPVGERQPLLRPSQANRTRMPTSNPSTADCATNASTSTGSRRYCTRAPKSNAGDANTTRTDPRKQSAA
ncbi:transposase InsO family protein [Xanthomonas arboricola]|nr:transposase InsO family protein [Xanthomonas campestris]